MMRRHARYLIAVAIIGLSAGGAFAQGSASQSACFEILAGPSRTQPAGAILLNRCDGQTWILVRTYEVPMGSLVYRWSAIGSDSTGPKTPASSPTSLPARPTASTRPGPSEKCSTFRGRRFCDYKGLDHFSITLTDPRRQGRARPGHPRLACGT